VDPQPVGVSDWFLDPQRFVVERVRIEDLPEWCKQHDVVPVCTLAWPDGETWPPAVLYAPRPAWAPGQKGEQGEGSGESGENRLEQGAPGAVSGDLMASAVQNSLPLF
jgi:hypothetical protein